jgi:hypothetical protein
MCNDCLSKGLWSHEENKELDKFINSFSRKKKPSYRPAIRKAQEDLPVAEALPVLEKGTESQQEKAQ